MAKNYQPIQVPQLDLESPSPKEPIDWSFCALCQKSNKENLVCPARKGPAARYTYVAENLEQFQEMGHNPLDISLSRFDEGNGFGNAFREHSASWHKPCFSKVSTTVLDRKRKQRECSSAASPVKTRRATGTSSAPSEQDASEDMEAQAGTSKKPRLCFFCNKPATYGDGVLHGAWTTQVHHNVYSHAVGINDSTVLRKLANTDMTADDCMCNLKCLTRHYRKKPKDQEDEREDETTKLQAVALAQVVAYIESCRDDPESRPLFYMSDLCDLYASRLKDLGLHVPERVHSRCLREKLLAAIPDLFSAQEGHGGQTSNRRHHRHSPKIRCTDVWSLQYTHDGGCGTPDIVCKKQQIFGQHTSNRGSSETAHPQSSVAVWSRVGAEPGERSTSPESSQLGMAKEGHESLDAHLDNSRTGQDACKELVKCGCRQGCWGRCSCRKANLSCTALCFCSGDCALED